MAKARTKTGPITAAEAAAIRAQAPHRPLEEVAADLNRSVGLVSRWAEDNLPRAAVPDIRNRDKDAIKSGLKRSLKWQYLRETLTPDETAFFEEQYACYVQQFKDDILPSEEDQIFNMISIDIAIHRNRRDVRLLREELTRLEDEYRSLPPFRERADDDRQRAIGLENLMGGLRSAETARTAEWIKLQGQVQSLQGELKATRAQRVGTPGSMKESWLDVLKNLTKPEYRDLVGTAAEFSRRSALQEEERLAAWHRYEDGKLDQPVLTSETALEEPE